MRMARFCTMDTRTTTLLWLSATKTTGSFFTGKPSTGLQDATKRLESLNRGQAIVKASFVWFFFGLIPRDVSPTISDAAFLDQIQ